jgi:hypothetical protein
MYSEEFFYSLSRRDIQPIENRLRIGQIVDENGRILPLPLETNKRLAYSIGRIRTKEQRAVQKSSIISI